MHTASPTGRKDGSSARPAAVLYNAEREESVMRKMHQVRVEFDKAGVYIIQDSMEDRNKDDIVLIAPEQAELLCEWIRDAAIGCAGMRSEGA